MFLQSVTNLKNQGVGANKRMDQKRIDKILKKKNCLCQLTIYRKDEWGDLHFSNSH